MPVLEGKIYQLKQVRAEFDFFLSKWSVYMHVPFHQSTWHLYQYHEALMYKLPFNTRIVGFNLDMSGLDGNPTKYFEKSLPNVKKW